MWRSSKARFDVATAIDRGGRDYQEDALIADFPIGSDYGIGVLADGMGGHSCGDIASAIVVTEVLSELKFRAASFVPNEDKIVSHLKTAVTEANRAMHQHVTAQPDTRGMGSTLVATVVVGPHLYWTSVGDSLLYLFRDGALKRLNEDHSMAPHIDAMVASGQLKADVGKTHPERNCLTSAIMGESVARVDCPARPMMLQAGDVLLTSSDGLQTLEEPAIERILQRNRKKTSDEITTALLDAVSEDGTPDQDNTSIMVVKILSDKPVAQQETRGAVAATFTSTRLVEATEVFDAVELDDEAQQAKSRMVVGQ